MPNPNSDEFRNLVKIERDKGKYFRHKTKVLNNMRKNFKVVKKKQKINDRKKLLRYCNYCDCKAFGMWKIWIQDGRIGVLQ